MLVSSVALLAIVTLTAGAPNYGQESGPSRQVSAASVECRTEYGTVWDTQYQERETQECVTNYREVCTTVAQRQCKPTTRKECKSIYEKQCSTVYKNVCVDQYKTEYEPYTETVCSTQYKEDCEYQWEGTGRSKVWVPIPGTCTNNPYDECEDVTKTKERQVAYPVCNKVPEQSCRDVPQTVCRDIPDQECFNQPLTQCKKVPEQQCHAVHKKVPVRVSKNVPKKVCDTGYDQITGETAIINVRTNQDHEKQKIVFQ